MRYVLAGLFWAKQERRARPSSCSSSKCISFSLSLGFVERQFLRLHRLVGAADGFSTSCSDLLRARELPHFNRHVGGTSSGPGRRRNPARNGISAFGSGYVDDPVAQQKLLRLVKDTVCKRQAVFLAAHNLGFPRLGQALRGHKLPGFSELLANGSQVPHMRLDIASRPGVIRVNPCLRAGHQQNVFHFVPSCADWLALLHFFYFLLE